MTSHEKFLGPLWSRQGSGEAWPYLAP